MSVVTIYIPPQVALPDNDQWRHRFEITGESGNIYTIAQHKQKKHWGCSCPGYRSKRKCKHLEAMGLPCHETPYEPRIEGGSRS